MVTIPNFEEENAKRPSRARKILVKECTRLINAMKSKLTRLGICTFNPKLRRAREKLESLRTPGLDPVSWTPDQLGERSPRCQEE